MKKLAIVALVAFTAMFAVSCKNQPKEAAAETPAVEVAPAAEADPAVEAAPAATEAAPAAEATK